MMPGELAAPLEVRVDGRTLTGEAMRYGERARDRAERFEPGALVPVEPVTLNLQHDPERRIASTADVLRLDHDDKALRIRAELREGSAELSLVRRGALGGLSVEFHPIAERRAADGVRVIERAALVAVGLVDVGSYRTTVELRRSLALVTEPRRWSGFTISSWVPSRRRLDCECSGPECHFAEMAEDGLEAAFDTAFAEDSTVIATWANYSQPVASVPSGTLRRAGATEVAIDLPDDDYGRAVLAGHESAGVVIRPYLDALESEAERVGETMVYTKPVIRAFVISTTDKRGGWPTPTITGPERAARRFKRWL